MIMRLFRLLALSLILINLSSCKFLRSNLMLKTPTNYTYDQLQDSVSKIDYKIEVNDFVTVRVFSNDGFKLVDISGNANMQMMRMELEYLVERDGYAKLPLIGRTKLAGLSKAEAETYLEQLYSDYYVKPFVTVKITNKRVIVFPGNGGAARVITLENYNTSVIEALALTGGIPEDGKAFKVKLIRRMPDGSPKVYLMDLSTIDGVKAGRTVVLANDIIYVEPRYRFARTLLGEITPIIGLITSTILLYTIIKR